MNIVINCYDEFFYQLIVIPIFIIMIIVIVIAITVILDY